MEVIWVVKHLGSSVGPGKAGDHIEAVGEAAKAHAGNDESIGGVDGDEGGGTKEHQGDNHGEASKESQEDEEGSFAHPVGSLKKRNQQEVKVFGETISFTHLPSN